MFALAEELRVTRPSLGVVMVRRRIDTAVLSDALRAGRARGRAGARPRGPRRRRTPSARDRRPAARADRARRGRGTGGSHRGRVVTVFSAKGGCGKTTLATNLAAALADSGKGSVALLDLDLAFGDVAIALQLFPSHTIADAVADRRGPRRPGAACRC